MGSDKFDFHTAEKLVKAIDASSANLETLNEKMNMQFSALREYFNDSGYDAFTGDMSGANRTIQDIVNQLRIISSRIEAYATRLKEEA